MEINTTLGLFAAQIISSLGLFWAVTSSFNNRINDVESKLNIKIDSKFETLSKEVNEVKVEINEVKIEQAKQGGEIHRLGDKVDHLNQRIDFLIKKYV